MRCVLAILLLSGCVQTTFQSEGKQLRFTTEDVAYGGFRDVVPGPVLVGTAICADVCVFADGDAIPCAPDPIATAASCFDAEVRGPAHLDGGCLVVDGPGEVDWAFTAKACDAGPYADDRVGFEGVAADAVTGRLEVPLDDFVLDLVGEVSPDGERLVLDPPVDPATLRLVAGAPIPIAPDGTVALSPALFDADGQPVLRNLSHEQVVATGADVQLNEDRTFYLSPRSEGGPIVLRGPAGDFALGTWVRAAAPASLQIVAAMLDSDNGRIPLGARAVIRDADDVAQLGAPVAWGVDGPLGLSPSTPGDPAVAVFDAESCIQPSARQGHFEATVQARYDGLDDQITIAWDLPAPERTAEELAADDAAWTLDPARCPGPLADDAGPCGCSSPARGAPGALVGVLALAMRRRRVRSDGAR